MKILSALLLVALSFGMTERAAAEVPVAGRLQDSSSPQGQSPHQKNHKYFMHHRGPNVLHQSKQDGVALLLRKRGHGPFGKPTPLGSTVIPSGTEVAGFDGIDENATFADPPDGAIAVGPTHIVEAVNTALSVWTKTYDQTGRLSALAATAVAVDLNRFLGKNSGCLSGTNSFAGLVSDPSLDYDAAHDRFMVAMISFDPLFRSSSLCVAVTQTGDPMGKWFIYAFPISPAASLLDSPRAVIGSDGQLYVAGNLFRIDRRSGNATFDSARVYAFRTSDLYAGLDTTPRIVTAGNDPQTGLPADSLTPARAVGVAGMYFVSASNPASPATGSAITLWKWSDPFGSNVFTRQGFVTVSDYTQPPSGIQRGGFPHGVTDCEQSGAACIETNDARNVTAYWSGNTVWAAHTIGCAQGEDPAACVGWYHLGNLDGAPSLLQQGIARLLLPPALEIVHADRQLDFLRGQGFVLALQRGDAQDPGVTQDEGVGEVRDDGAGGRESTNPGFGVSGGFQPTVKSFLFVARERGLEVGVGYRPRGRHNLATIYQLFPDMAQWLLWHMGRIQHSWATGPS
jgi:hypothetical protein